MNFLTATFNRMKTYVTETTLHISR